MFDKAYFIGASKSAYTDYSTCSGVLNTYAGMLNTIFNPSSVFDGGCAYGYVPDWFMSNGITAKGCDASEFAVSHSNNCYVSLLDSIPEESCSYDLVTSSEVMEHVPETSIDAALSELVRISSKYVVLLIALFPEGTTSDPGDSTHITLHPYEWWSAKLSPYNRDYEKEAILNTNPYSVTMNWNGRFFVINKNKA